MPRGSGISSVRFAGFAPRCDGAAEPSEGRIAMKATGHTRVPRSAAMTGRAARIASLIAAALLALAPSALAAARPTGDAGISLRTAVTGGVAGAVDAGVEHSCGVETDGTLACWG